jgi:hypothetical protein
MDTAGNALEEVRMQVGSAFFAVILFIVNLLLCSIANTQTMLPNAAYFTLNHKFASIRVVLGYGELGTRREKNEEEMGAHHCCHRHSA